MLFSSPWCWWGCDDLVSILRGLGTTPDHSVPSRATLSDEKIRTLLWQTVREPRCYSAVCACRTAGDSLRPSLDFTVPVKVHANCLTACCWCRQTGLTGFHQWYCPRRGRRSFWGSWGLSTSVLTSDLRETLAGLTKEGAVVAGKSSSTVLAFQEQPSFGVHLCFHRMLVG